MVTHTHTPSLEEEGTEKPSWGLSLVGYSAGGLFVRYCVGLMEHEGFFSGSNETDSETETKTDTTPTTPTTTTPYNFTVTPLHLVTIATPHLGVCIVG